MKFKILLLFFTALFSNGIFAQDKTFSFCEIQSRNDLQQWGQIENTEMRTARFSEKEIFLNIDKDYHLNIISTTQLPNNGFIFLCKDDKLNPITVMLIDNLKMYLYNQSKRFMINFNAGSFVASND